MDIEDTPQFKQGKEVEAWLDNFFEARGWAIEQTSQREERGLHLGDRTFRLPDHKWRLFVEYKSGIQTYHTGNIFIETVSVDTQSVPGWAYTCQADYIFYAPLKNLKILIFKPDDLRAELPRLKERCREVPTSGGQNEGYNSRGLLVPLATAERLAGAVINITEQELIEHCKGE